MEATARKLDTYMEEEYRVEQAEKTVRRKVKRQNSERLVYLKRRFFITLSVLMVFLASLIILNGYASISELKMEISQMDKEIVNLNKSKQNLTGKVEELKSSSNIVAEAKYKLGMVYPDESQVVYFTLDESTGETIEDEGVINRVITALKTLSISF